jgi:hypothetical protein
MHAEDQTERIERLEDGLRRIIRWSEAYPLEVFPEPDDAYYKAADAVLRANNMTLDRLSAAAMRHVILRVADIAKDALDER